MIETISAELAAHYASGSTTLTQIWKITRLDAAVFGFTSHDRPLEFEGTRYQPSSVFDASAVATRAELNVDNLEVKGLLSDIGIQTEDIEAGFWDGAKIEIREVNYADLSMGCRILRVGDIGKVQRKTGQYVVELRGIMQKLQNNIGRLVTPTCDADLGDARCMADLFGSPGYSAAGTVGNIVSARRAFTLASFPYEAGAFDGGYVLALDGLNENIKREIKTHTATGSPIDGAIIELQLPFPSDLTTGDSLQLVMGCDKTAATCKAKFDNLLNFRGFPAVPGPDRILKIGGQ